MDYIPSMCGMKRLVLTILTAWAMFSGTSCNPSSSALAPSEVASRLAESADPSDRLALEGAIETLKASERNGTVTDVQSEALSSLWASAIRDGKISDDERHLLTSLVIELASTPENRKEETSP